MTKTKKVEKTIEKEVKVVDYQKLWDKDPENEDNLRQIIRKSKDRELVRLAASKLELVKSRRQFKVQKEKSNA